MRCGHWIVLDELNLAPTEVLEALNRLLDDNRELYVPELQVGRQCPPLQPSNACQVSAVLSSRGSTMLLLFTSLSTLQEVVKPHPHFMLFATQVGIVHGADACVCVD